MTLRPKCELFAAIACVLLACAQASAQWEVVKRAPSKPTKTLNVDVPPTTEMRPPIVWSLSFVDDLRGWVAGNGGLIFHTPDGGETWSIESDGWSSYIRGLTATRTHLYAYGNDGVILRRKL